MKIMSHTPFDDLPQFLNVEEVRVLTRIGRSTLYDAIRRGEISVARFGRVVRVPKEELRHLMVKGNEGNIDVQQP